MFFRIFFFFTVAHPVNVLTGQQAVYNPSHFCQPFETLTWTKLLVLCCAVFQHRTGFIRITQNYEHFWIFHPFLFYGTLLICISLKPFTHSSQWYTPHLCLLKAKPCPLEGLYRKTVSAAHKDVYLTRTIFYREAISIATSA